MKRESPLSEYRVLREFSYALLYYFLGLQYSVLGNPNVEFIVLKSIWSDVMGVLRRRFFGELLTRPTYYPRTLEIKPDLFTDYSTYSKRKDRLEFPQGVVRREDLETKDQEIFDFLAKDWNRIYLELRDKTSILGYIAQALIEKGEYEDDLKKMTLPEFSETSKTYNLPGLEDIEALKETLHLTDEQTYSLLYGKSKGAEWLAIYDQNGERKGKAYKLVTQMYREQIAECLERNATEEEIRSIMLSPDDTEIKKAFGLFEENISEEQRSKREKEYEELVTNHLNRDMTRFAYTELSINFNNGKLLYLINEKKTPSYVKFGGGNY
ncbi:hypothetical protein LEP1GSC132_2507 [Leptospira kirschneri str. 200803703]|uniref:hypothetical protein n=1 Tax=Leptospira kirschneri TaxID=29507 RepID=UPI0002BDC59E|nr:hypothetical protein [Leptospira kirschneri]EMO66409.1 hypothetical protein LEP1GSC132_2507 [Leptospira kirschneri str. 200803703]